VLEGPDGIGQYGGVWRRGFTGPSDYNNYVRVVYDSLVRFSPDGTKVEPKIAKGWENSADFKEWTVFLREGAKWSDGQPLTADDIMFWYNDVLLNKDLTPSLPKWMKNADGSGEGRKVDDTTVRFTYAAPRPVPDGGQPGRSIAPCDVPAGALTKKFIRPYAQGRHRQGRASGSDLTELFANRNAPPENRAPDHGRLGAEQPRQQSVFLKRNPYFIGVDSAGNQLPYLDEVRFTCCHAQALNLAAIAGNFDMQERHINMTNYPSSRTGEDQEVSRHRLADVRRRRGIAIARPT
jgi:peptide/nickel transport system substrate-binding protein